MTEPSRRPPLDPGLPPDEFARWYWLKRELQAFAAELGIPADGGKQDLAARIARRLSGEQDIAPPRRPATDGLPASLDRDTVIPDGQRLTARLRAFMAAECGPGFRFDGHMRAFFADAGGRTLGDAVDHWRATRTAPRPEIGAQFEWNRFARAWRAANPGALHAEVVAAWQAHRALPADERPPVG